MNNNIISLCTSNIGIIPDIIYTSFTKYGIAWILGIYLHNPILFFEGFRNHPFLKNNHQNYAEL
jgi:hypothetical protein